MDVTFFLFALLVSFCGIGIILFICSILADGFDTLFGDDMGDWTDE